MMGAGALKLFDLNIEELLDHWEVEHAIREVIANALDERLLTGTRPIEIFEDKEGAWHVRDHGRGLAIEHFTLNENAEKRGGPRGVIGKFGVGLKDALATFHRRDVDITIESSAGWYRLREATKHSFDEITTLHVEHQPGRPAVVGTDFILDGVSATDIETAKSMFLEFTEEHVLEETPYGQILDPGDATPRVYISGVFANEEPRFLFSYNVTDLREGMRKRLNRERLNVGRTTYAERIKGILKGARSQEVCDRLAEQVSALARGDQVDEMQWIEVAQHALNLLHDRRQVTFVTETELSYHPDVVDNMRRDGFEVVVVDDAQKEKLAAQVEAGDDELRTLEGYDEQFNDSFSYEFVDAEDLTPAEGLVFSRKGEILRLIEGGAERLDIRISETMRVTLDNTAGVWDSELDAVVIKRSQLGSIIDFAGTLLHEAAHALTGTLDATREFESVLTEYLGCASAVAMKGEALPAIDRG